MIGSKADWLESRLASAAYLKFLRHKRRIRSRNFQWKNGTRNQCFC